MRFLAKRRLVVNILQFYYPIFFAEYIKNLNTLKLINNISSASTLLIQ